MRVSTHISEGALRRACAALLQDTFPPMSPTNDVVSALRLLHLGLHVDERSSLGTLRNVAPHAAPTDVDQIRKAPRLEPLGQASDRHIRDATRPASTDLLLRMLSEIVSLLLRGEVPDPVRPCVCGAAIMALRKPSGSFRSMAIGEPIRRLTNKVALDLVTDHARSILEPLLLGVKTPNGCEVTVHVTRPWFHRHRSDPSLVALSVDISNAFNSVHRNAALQAVHTHFPSPTNWPLLSAREYPVHWFREYHVPGHLHREECPTGRSSSPWPATWSSRKPVVSLRDLNRSCVATTLRHSA